MIPDYQTLMLPVLKYVSDGKEHALKDLREAMAKEFKVTAKERKKLLPSGKQPVFDNRVGWACTYLKKAKLIQSPKRGILKITPAGINLLKTNPKVLNNQMLFLKEKDEPTHTPSVHEEPIKTPRETLSESYELIRKQLAEELLEQVMNCSPSFFEDLVVKLLVAMGYGGSLEDAGQRVGGTGDGGIDGIIKEDKLGLSQIYIQAKRWEKSVGSPEISQFVGALSAKNAEKGVFITTSKFTANAIEFVQKVPKNIVLIDGEYLANLMIDYNVGVTEEESYVVKRIDSDFFE